MTRPSEAGRGSASPGKQELMYRGGSFLAWAGATLLARSARLEIHGSEEAETRERAGKPSIMVTWHGRTLLPIWYYGPRHWSAMISLSRDGEYQARIFRRFGWDIVRGSSGRGGVRALVGAVKKIREGASFAFTPDGPKGPSHTVHHGVLFLSQKAGCPIFPVGISAYPRLFLPTWDRYQIPMPCSRVAMIYGAPLEVPAAAGESEFARLAEQLGQRICGLEQQAEELVTPPGARVPCTVGQSRPSPHE